MMKSITVFVVLILCVLGAFTAKAHGSGVTIDNIVGDYIIDVDYDAISGIYSGDPVQFSFRLLKKDRSDQSEFSDVWVSITPSGKDTVLPQPVFDGAIAGSTFPPSGMTFVFPYPGSYTLNLRYEKNDQTLAEANFPLEVQAGSQSVDGGQKNGFFRITNDFLKGLITAMFAVMLVIVGQVLVRKKKM